MYSISKEYGLIRTTSKSHVLEIFFQKRPVIDQNDTNIRAWNSSLRASALLVVTISKWFVIRTTIPAYQNAFWLKTTFFPELRALKLKKIEILWFFAYLVQNTPKNVSHFGNHLIPVNILPHWSLAFIKMKNQVSVVNIEREPSIPLEHVFLHVVLFSRQLRSTIANPKMNRSILHMFVDSRKFFVTVRVEASIQILDLP